MSRGLSGSTETFLIGVVAGAVFAVMAVLNGCGLTDPSPKEKADKSCEQAWVDANDGDDDTKAAPVLDEPWCAEHTKLVMTDQPQETTP